MGKRKSLPPGRFVHVLFACLWLQASMALGAEVPRSLLGAWQSRDGAEIVLIEADRLVVWQAGKLRVLGVLDHEDGWLTVRRSGLLERWRATSQGRTLTLERGDAPRAFERLDTVPELVQLAPAALPAPVSLAPERIASIQRELASRLEEDQRALKSEAPDKERVIAENTSYLRSLAQEVGWIDAGRFGSRISYAAVILAKHGGDLRLLLAALPWIEKDFKQAGDDAQAFAIVYDSVQLDLGRKQRFGTQIRGAGGDKPFVLPLEDPGRVDAFRGEIGLPPLAEYLSEAGKVLGVTISMPPEEAAVDKATDPERQASPEQSETGEAGGRPSASRLAA